MRYGRLVGAWDVESTRYEQGAVSRTARGEWHFTWMPGGLGIQDVPFRSGALARELGTAVRCCDPATDTRRVTWIQPASGEVVHLTGRKVGDRIVQEGSGADPRRRERWSFADITADAFVWLGEVSYDGGATWTLEQEMHARRRGSRDARSARPRPRSGGS